MLEPTPEANDKLDKILSHLDSLHSKHDALMAKHDALHARHDALEGKHEELSKRFDAFLPSAGKREANITPEDEAAERREREELERTDAARRLQKDAEHEQADLPNFVDAQRRADTIAQAFGDSGGAPRWLAGESLADYRRRLLSKYKSYSADWKDVDLANLHESALGIAEAKIYADAAREAQHPTDLGPGKLREVRSRDAYGRTFTKFYGDPAVAYAPFSFNGLIRRGRIVNPIELQALKQATSTR